MMDDLVAFTTRFEEVDPGAVELLPPRVVERLGCGLRRSVRGREELPVLFAGRGSQDRVVLLELELEGLAQKLAYVILLTPCERTAATLGRRRHERAHHPEHLTEPAFRSPAGESNASTR